jgi:hypothetical protein
MLAQLEHARHELPPVNNNFQLQFYSNRSKKVTPDANDVLRDQSSKNSTKKKARLFTLSLNKID